MVLVLVAVRDDDSQCHSRFEQILSRCSPLTSALVAQQALMVLSLLILALRLLTVLSEEERRHGR